VGVLEHDQRAGAQLAVLIAGVARDGWSAATPCSEWSVHCLVAHLIAGNVKYAGIARGDDFLPGAPPVNVGDDPAATYRETLSDMLQAWREPGALDREIGLPRGERGRAEVAACIHLAETLGDGWDLATATDQDPASMTRTWRRALPIVATACRPNVARDLGLPTRSTALEDRSSISSQDSSDDPGTTQ
jgi:uncharacterized protein (TIGR03086 family)